ncbi:MAG: hypothetical protein GC191_08915 [Azospirillum sp.]|nr:hypothetical protein [Azospirillum sp.]
MTDKQVAGLLRDLQNHDDVLVPHLGGWRTRSRLGHVRSSIVFAAMARGFLAVGRGEKAATVTDYGRAFANMLNCKPDRV